MPRQGSVVRPTDGKDDTQQPMRFVARASRKIEGVAHAMLVVAIALAVPIPAEFQGPQSFDLDRRTGRVGELAKKRAGPKIVGVDAPVPEISNQKRVVQRSKVTRRHCP